MVKVFIKDSDELFCVRRLYCVGRNYGEHSKEMGHDSNEPPFFFCKPSDAVWQDFQNKLPYPPRTNNLHHEVELVVAIGEGGFNIVAENASNHIFGFAVGVDLTRRDLQAQAKQQARPWDMAKGFDNSAPMSAIVKGQNINRGKISLSVNGVLRQSGDLSQQIWSVEDIIAELSTYINLQSGDLIFTGTPAGVASLQVGDMVEAEIESVGKLSFTIGEKRGNE